MHRLSHWPPTAAPPTSYRGLEGCVVGTTVPPRNRGTLSNPPIPHGESWCFCKKQLAVSLRPPIELQAIAPAAKPVRKIVSGYLNPAVMLRGVVSVTVQLSVVEGQVVEVTPPPQAVNV
jgi:hypothetical protein